MQCDHSFLVQLATEVTPYHQVIASEEEEEVY